jgi:hypothetical protein
MASKRIVRRVALERASRALLSRLLLAHGEAFFEAHGVSLAALATTSPRDRAVIHRIFDLVHDRAIIPALPASMRAALEAFDTLATPAGGEAILRADEKALIPRATYGDEDLALVMLLDHPELAVDARREAEADEVQSFTEYEPETPGAIRFGDDERSALERALGVKLEAKDRTRMCTVHLRREGSVVSLEIVHGRRPKTFDKVDAKTLEIDQSTDTHTERAFAEVDVDAGTAAIHAARGIKELVRGALGEVVASNEGHFRAARTYDLAPFAALPDALSTAGAPPRLQRVELHAIHLMTPNGASVMSFVRSRKDLLQDEEVRDALAAALRCGVPVAVKLYLVVAERARAVCVELSTKGGRNLVDFDRSDPEIVDIVRGYLRARGVLRDVSTASVTPFEPATASVR